MTKIILEGQDAQNYIEMLNRIKELEELVKKQTPLDVGASANSGLIDKQEPIRALYSEETCGKITATKTLSEAIDQEQPKMEVITRTDLPKDFVHGIEEPPELPGELGESKDEINWMLFVDSNQPHVSKDKKKWKDYEELAVNTAANQTDKNYFSIEVIAKYLGRTVSSVKTKAISMGYKTKKGMIKS